jgi:hypothetical protein
LPSLLHLVMLSAMCDVRYATPQSTSSSHRRRSFSTATPPPSPPTRITRCVRVSVRRRHTRVTPDHAAGRCDARGV